MNSKLRMIIAHYGIDKQLKYLQSEVFELNEAILDYKKDSWSDCLILYVMQYMMNFQRHFQYQKPQILEKNILKKK